MADTLTLRTALALLSLATPLLASSAARAEPRPRVFALIVANNRSSTLSVPDLQYADDDGARYYRLFLAASEAANVALLTNFDRTTRRVYPELAAVAQAPTRSTLEREIARLSQGIRAAHERGEKTIFYFAYAGHGRVDAGRGYIELEDRSVDGEFIEHRIIEQLPADQKHIILDSCNSFFVINARKPGGRRWATPEDMALGFSARHPEVGLFLATNSDSEVFEWSELESGVFSHEVRSGLSGAADVNRDGQVSYAELAGFVERANSGISRESLRPRLFFRGPRGDANAALFASAAVAGRQLELPSVQTRFWLKNATGDRLLDAHKEAGPMTLVVPASSSEELSLFMQRAPVGAGAHPTIVQQTLPAGEHTRVVASVDGDSPVVASRGDRLFGNLFEKPYGQQAFAEYQRESAHAPVAVYGVRDADLLRMHNYLSAMAAQGRYERRLGGGVYLSIGAIYGAVAVGSLYDRPRTNLALPMGILASAGLGAGLFLSLSPSTSEQALRAFETELEEHRGDHSLAFARTEEKLQLVASRERLTRNITFWSLESLGVLTGALVGVSLADRKNQAPSERLSPSAYAGLFAASGVLIAGGFLIRATDTPTERFLHLYQDDPGLKLQVSVAGLPGGGSVGLVGTF